MDALIGGLILIAIIFALAKKTKRQRKSKGKQRQGQSKAEYKGQVGEKRVNQILSTLSKESYKMYSDLYVTHDNGKITQIDHVVVSPYGIFVIETKNYSGWIFGNVKNRNWTQVIGKAKHAFFNPLRQNYGHIQALQNQLGIGADKFHSIIAFDDKCTLKNDELHKIEEVVKFSDLKNKLLSKTEMILSAQEVSDVQAKIDWLIATTNKKEIANQHLQQLQSEHQSV